VFAKAFTLAMLDIPIFTRQNHPAFNSHLSFLDYQRYAVWDIAEWQAANRGELGFQGLSFSDRVRYAFFSALSGRRQWQPPTAPIDGHALTRILLFRYDAIGDYICSSPVLRWLKAAHPALQIDVVSSYRNDMLVRADFNVAQAYPIHPGQSFHTSWIRLVRTLHTVRYDAILALVFTRMSKAALLASLISRTAKKISIQHDKRAAIYGLVFDYQVPAVAYEEHWSRTMLRAVTASIAFPHAPEVHNLPTYLSLRSCDVEPVLHLVQHQRLDFSLSTENVFIDAMPTSRSSLRFRGRPYCVVNVSASPLKPDCAWSIERVVEMCTTLVQHYPELVVFVTGAPSEQAKVGTAVKAVGSKHCQPLMLPLLQIAAAIAGAKFVLTPDTAVVHIASAAGVPVVGLYSQLRSIAEWYPYQSPFALLLSPNEGSINHIPISRVHEALEWMLSETKISLVT
jgi:ADP-heptose:LPS heptosyltransferase